jgi:hypothetical protein
VLRERKKDGGIHVGISVFALQAAIRLLRGRIFPVRFGRNDRQYSRRSAPEIGIGIQFHPEQGKRKRNGRIGRNGLPRKRPEAPDSRMANQTSDIYSVSRKQWIRRAERKFSRRLSVVILCKLLQGVPAESSRHAASAAYRAPAARTAEIREKSELSIECRYNAGVHD